MRLLDPLPSDPSMPPCAPPGAAAPDGEAPAATPRAGGIGPQAHPAAGLLERLLSSIGPAPRASGLAVVVAAADLDAILRHLSALCPDCRATCERFRHLAQTYGHWRDDLLAIEGPAAPRLYGQLTTLPFCDQLAAVARHRGYHTWSLAWLLRQRSVELAPSDPRRAEQHASVAHAIAAKLDAATYDPAWLADLCALCHLAFADARRRHGDRSAARVAFALAAGELAAGTGDPALAAEAAARNALLHRDQGDLCQGTR
jgi:hypothetical protein